MLRTIAALSALGALALVIAVSLSGEGENFSDLLAGGPQTESLVNPNTGEPVTLEAVQKDVEWHRETAQKLRDRD